MRKEKELELESLRKKNIYISKREMDIEDGKKKFVNVRKYEFEYEDGKKQIREVIGKHGGVGDAASIISITKEGIVTLIVQPRPSTDSKVLMELPAGYIDPNEEPILAAKRELLEETGLDANVENITYIGWYYQDTGISNAKIHLFIAKNCIDTGKQKLDADEIISIFKCNLDELFELYDRGEFKGASSQILIPRVRELYERK